MSDINPAVERLAAQLYEVETRPRTWEALSGPERDQYRAKVRAVLLVIEDSPYVLREREVFPQKLGGFYDVADGA